MQAIAIETVSYQQEFQKIQRIRRIVFQEEQGVSPELEFDGNDDSTEHLLAYLNGRAVGTLRIRKLSDRTVKIERLAVLKQSRGQGIGRRLMDRALENVCQDFFSEVIIHAQAYLQEFYQSLGFEQVGELFQEAGINHIKMILKLNPD